jgi:2-polyprenyl-3-methyl-5-hydroxy-6-metoxy-1,4-benzoquinol methylase
MQCLSICGCTSTELVSGCAGCGYGLALQMLAEAYPKSTFHGFDISKVALQAAGKRTSSLPNVTLHDASQPGQAMKQKQYDFAVTLDAIHDMAHPDPVLRSVHDALKVRCLPLCWHQFAT